MWNHVLYSVGVTDPWRQCLGTTKKGQRCGQMIPWYRGDYCRWHSDQASDENAKLKMEEEYRYQSNAETSIIWMYVAPVVILLLILWSGTGKVGSTLLWACCGIPSIFFFLVGLNNYLGTYSRDKQKAAEYLGNTTCGQCGKQLMPFRIIGTPEDLDHANVVIRAHCYICETSVEVYVPID